MALTPSSAFFSFASFSSSFFSLPLLSVFIVFSASCRSVSVTPLINDQKKKQEPFYSVAANFDCFLKGSLGVLPAPEWSGGTAVRGGSELSSVPRPPHPALGSGTTYASHMLSDQGSTITFHPLTHTHTHQSKAYLRLCLVSCSPLFGA